jgi:chemotaxis protein CheD
MSAAVRLLQESIEPEILTVEMAEMRVSVRLTDTLAAFGLGACVAVCIYDPTLKVAGLAHIVAPRQQSYTDAAAAKIAGRSPAKFADTAIPMLIDSIDRAGGRRTNLRAAIVGGAAIFGSIAGPSALPSGLEIGDRNITATIEELTSHDIMLCGAAVGGNCGRTVMFRVCDGAVIVKPIGGEASVLTILSRATGGVVV